MTSMAIALDVTGNTFQGSGLHEQPSHPQLQSLIFTLPAELRFHIWQSLFTIPPSSHSTNDTCHNAVSISWTSQHSNKPPSLLSILVTCRRLYAETAPLFYSLNRLYITNRQIGNINHIHDFFGTLAPYRLGRVRDVVLAVATFGDVLGAWEVIRDVMPRLERVEFVVRIAFDVVDDAQRLRGEFVAAFGAEGRGRLRELHLTHKWVSQLSPSDLWNWRRFGEDMTMALAPCRVVTCRL